MRCSSLARRGGWKIPVARANVAARREYPGGLEGCHAGFAQPLGGEGGAKRGAAARIGWYGTRVTGGPPPRPPSAPQFRHQDILQTIRSALSTAGLHGSALEIELTESALMTNPEESAGILKQLRKMGVSVAIDDFGTGYSSLSYLRRFPIDKLKI